MADRDINFHLFTPNTSAHTNTHTHRHKQSWANSAVWGIWGQSREQMKTVAYFLAPHKIHLLKPHGKVLLSFFGQKTRCRKLLCQANFLERDREREEEGGKEREIGMHRYTLAAFLTFFVVLCDMSVSRSVSRHKDKLDTERHTTYSASTHTQTHTLTHNLVHIKEHTLLLCFNTSKSTKKKIHNSQKTTAITSREKEVLKQC